MMGETVVLVVAATIFLWGVISARLERADLTAPIVFMAVGAVLAGAGAVHGPSAPETVKPLVEITLVWVLFSDAARLRVQDLRADVGMCVRLLAVGLPLTVLLGWGLAAWLFPAFGVWLALLVAAALAPTDAALGVPVVTNPVVPSRVRRLITVESGLNDGIATPVVMLAIAGAASAEAAGEQRAGPAAIELLIGAGVGTAVGAGGGWLLRRARRARGPRRSSPASPCWRWRCSPTWRRQPDGNGFVAAFWVGSPSARGWARGPAELLFLEQASGLVSCWCGWPSVPSPCRSCWTAPSPTTLLYAVLSLTLVRMVPVALGSVGARLDRETVLFIGWFGPRGLASLVFALLALEELGPGADEAVSVIAVTVFLSVLAHGVSAGPLAARYGRRQRAAGRRRAATVSPRQTCRCVASPAEPAGPLRAEHAAYPTGTDGRSAEVPAFGPRPPS